MTGSRDAFEAAVRRARERAAAEQWDDATVYFWRALKECPDDIPARAELARALSQLGRWDEAASEYQRLLEQSPQDLSVVTPLAQAYTRLDRIADAVDLYLSLAHARQDAADLPGAIEALRAVLSLRPEAMEPRLRLLDLLRESGDQGELLSELLILARQEATRGNRARALVHAEAAYELDAENIQVWTLLEWLRRPDPAAADAPPPEPAPPLEDPTPAILGAMRLLESGDDVEAMGQFERLLSQGADRPEVHYALGVLYRRAERAEAAIDSFYRAARDDEYALSSYYALGECFRGLGRLAEAAQSFERAVRLIDLRSVARNEVEDVIRLYESAAQAAIDQGNLARAASLYATLSQFLLDRRYHRAKTDEIREKAELLTVQSMHAKLAGGGATDELRMAEVETAGDPSARPSGRATGRVTRALRPITDFLRGQPEQPLPPPSHPVAGEGRHGTRSVGQPETAAGDAGAVGALPGLGELPSPSLSGENALEIEEQILASQRYCEDGLYTAALDACNEVIRLAPYYLPIHHRLAQIFQAQGRTSEAVTKYQLLADLHQVRGEPAAAATALKRLLSMEPMNAGALARLPGLMASAGQEEAGAEAMLSAARTYEETDKAAAAEEVYARACALAPAAARVRAEYAAFLLRNAKPRAALEELKHAFKLAPEDPRVLVLISATFVFLCLEREFWASLQRVAKHVTSQEAASQAADTLEWVLARQDQPRLRYVLGLVLARAREDDRAVAHLQAGLHQLERRPDPLLVFMCYRALGDVYLHRDALPESVFAFEQALRYLDSLEADTLPMQHLGLERPPKATLYLHLGEARARLGDLAAATAAVQRVKEFLPGDRRTHSQLADLYFRQGDLRQALAELDAMAQSYEAAGQVNDLLEIRRHMARLAPGNAEVRAQLGAALLKRGNLDEGVAELRVAATVQRQEGMIDAAAETLLRIGEVCWQALRPEEALAAYQAALELLPSNAHILEQLGNVGLLAGQPALAATYFGQLGSVHLAADQPRDALAALRQATSLAPHEPALQALLGQALQATSDPRGAAEVYEKLKAMVPGDPGWLDWYHGEQALSTTCSSEDQPHQR